MNNVNEWNCGNNITVSQTVTANMGPIKSVSFPSNPWS